VQKENPSVENIEGIDALAIGTTEEREIDGKRSGDLEGVKRKKLHEGRSEELIDERRNRRREKEMITSETWKRRIFSIVEIVRFLI
jgi:hypothetical protein